MSNQLQTLTGRKSSLRFPASLLGWIAWIVWFCIVGILIITFIRSNPAWQKPAGLIVSVLNPSSTAPIVFVANRDMPTFTLITKDIIDLKPDSQLRENNQVEKQKQVLLDRITLKHYEKGDPINSTDLGPKLSPNVNYLVREIVATSPISWIHIGDTISFNLIVIFCSPTSTPILSAVATPKCPPPATARTEFQKMMNTVILQVGEPGRDGTIPLLIAIPTIVNQGILPLLDRAPYSIVAYPMTNVTAASTNISN